MKPEFIEEGMKWCRKCDEVHPLRNFPPDTRNKDGRHSWCRDCVKSSESYRLAQGSAEQRRYAKGYVPPWAKT